MPCDIIIICKFMFAPVNLVLFWAGLCMICLHIPSTKQRACLRAKPQYLFEISASESRRQENNA